MRLQMFLAHLKFYYGVLNALNRLVFLLMTLLCSAPVWAHQASTAYLKITQDAKDQTLYRVNYELALRDVMLLLPLDQNNDLSLTWGELQAQQAELKNLIAQHVVLKADGNTCTAVSHEDFWLDSHAGEPYVLQKSLYRCKTALSLLDYSVLADIDDAHRVILTINTAQSATQPAALDSSKTNVENAELSSVQSFPLAVGSHPLTVQQHVWWRYVFEGIHHLLIGWDHLLFLFSLVVAAVYVPIRLTRPIQLQPVNNAWQALKRTFLLATTFTVAHSITLCLAALELISLPSRLIESIIALSIAVVALNNLKPLFWQGILPVTFAFGLIHGFGFANVIVDLPVATLDKALALFLFNLGIELGQILCIIIALPIAFYFRKTKLYKHLIFQGGSLIAVLFGLYWFMQRAFAL